MLVGKECQMKQIKKYQTLREVEAQIPNKKMIFIFLERVYDSL